MTAPFWIGTSWKMNKTLSAAREYARALAAASLPDSAQCQVFVIPPHTALASVWAELADSRVLVGAQNMHWAESGAYTGEISPAMVADCGANLIELGHSERREYFNETDADVNRKVLAGLAHGLQPLICVGETAAERDFGVAAETVARQVKIALHGVSNGDRHRVLIAYEPVWAIGERGRPATPEDVAPIHACIKEAVADLFGDARVPVLYGGSVNPDNCAALAALDTVDGLFVGRSAWDVDGLRDLIQRVGQVRGF